MRRLLWVLVGAVAGFAAAVFASLMSAAAMGAAGIGSNVIVLLTEFHIYLGIPAGALAGFWLGRRKADARFGRKAPDGGLDT